MYALVNFEKEHPCHLKKPICKSWPILLSQILVSKSSFVSTKHTMVQASLFFPLSLGPRFLLFTGVICAGALKLQQPLRS